MDRLDEELFIAVARVSSRKGTTYARFSALELGGKGKFVPVNGKSAEGRWSVSLNRGDGQ